MKLKAVGKMQTQMARSTSSSRTLVFVLVAFVIYIVIYLVVGGESDEDGDIVSDTPLPVRIVKAPKAAKPMSQSEDVTIRLNIMIGKAARTETITDKTTWFDVLDVVSKKLKKAPSGLQLIFDLPWKQNGSKIPPRHVDFQDEYEVLLDDIKSYVTEQKKKKKEAVVLPAITVRDAGNDSLASQVRSIVYLFHCIS